MAENIRIVYDGGSGEIIEKKSRFIADVEWIESEEDAAAFVERVRKKYWDARHHCSAYVLGDKNQISRCSDDGEPSGTAGRPILDVLIGSGVHNACIVVTRYFGGVLLGTGGLVRAYGRAAKEGLDQSVILEQIPGRKIQINCDYNSIGKIQYIAGKRGYQALDSEYSDTVQLTYLIPEEEADRFCAEITEATNGKAKLESLGSLRYGILDKEFIIFD